MKGKAKVTKLYQDQYTPIVWVKDATQPKGKRQLEIDACDTEAIAKHVISHLEDVHEVFFSDIKHSVKEIHGTFYIDRGYYS